MNQKYHILQPQDTTGIKSDDIRTYSMYQSRHVPWLLQLTCSRVPVILTPLLTALVAPLVNIVTVADRPAAMVGTKPVLPRFT